MIRNILYSLFLHSILALFIYFDFDFYEYKESKSESVVTVNFITKDGNSDIFLNNKNPTSQEGKKKKKDSSAKQKKKNSHTKKKKSDAKKSQKTEDKLTKKDDQKTKAKKENYKKPDSEDKAEKQEENLEDLIEKNDPIQDSDPNSESVTDELKTTQNSKRIDAIDLSMREKFNIKTQIKRCYKRAINESEIDSKILIDAHIIIERDGTIDLELVTFKDYYKYNDPQELDFRIAVDNVKRAISLCSPLRNLPKEKYEIWRELELQFDGSI